MDQNLRLLCTEMLRRTGRCRALYDGPEGMLLQTGGNGLFCGIPDAGALLRVLRGVTVPKDAGFTVFSHEAADAVQREFGLHAQEAYETLLYLQPSPPEVPACSIRPLTAEDKDVIAQFWTDYEAEFPKGDNAKARDELELAKKMLALVGRPYFLAGGMFDGEKLIALSLAEKCGDTLIIHIEKALYSYTGVYPTLVQAFADAFGDGCQWINREDDAADRGLRTSKLQYGPAKLAPKYRFEPQNELLRHVSQIPDLKTERLTLSALTEADIPAYNALVLDGDRNRWWGYDDVGGLGGPVEERSFFEVAQRDFENRQAVNFAVRLDGKLIGEAVLYRFDCRGGAELGCRIDAAYAGHGYGTEAFAAVADWGLYRVHLSKVVAKCFKENQASYKMLSSCMRKAGEDETFFYFEKLV